MKNHWLSSVRKKRLLNSIDDVGMDVWSDDGTFGEFLKRLTKEQKDFFVNLLVADFSCEIDQDTFRIELTYPS